jgi:transcriptional regulator with XRE-family HTH domain
MGQGIGGVPEAPAVGDDAVREPAGAREPAQARELIGRYIAQQRRLRGIELEELATRTRIPRRSLERLEAGAFDHSPDGFSRGFVRTVAEAIGLDPDDAVARMLPEPDGTRLRSPRRSRALGVVAAVVALAALVLAARELAFRAATPRAKGALPVRRDYVRELAAQQGIEVAALTERDAALAPLPPEPRPPLAPSAAAEALARPASPESSISSRATSIPGTPAANPPARGDPPNANVLVPVGDGPPASSASPASEAREGEERESAPAALAPTPDPTPSPDAEDHH